MPRTLFNLTNKKIKPFPKFDIYINNFTDKKNNTTTNSKNTKVSSYKNVFVTSFLIISETLPLLDNIEYNGILDIIKKNKNI